MRSTRNSRSSSIVTSHAATYQWPSADEDLLRVDDPRASTPPTNARSSRRARADARAPRRGSARAPRSALPGSAVSIPPASPSVSGPSDVRSLSSAERERRRLRHARRAEQLGPAEVERERLAAGQPQRPGEVLGHRDPDAIVLVDVHLDQVAGPVRRQAGHEQQVEVAPELLDGHVEQPGHLGQLAPGVLHQVRHDHEHPPEPLRGLRCPRLSAQARSASRRATTWSRSVGGSTTIASGPNCSRIGASSRSSATGTVISIPAVVARPDVLGADQAAGGPPRDVRRERDRRALLPRRRPRPGRDQVRGAEPVGRLAPLPRVRRGPS